MTAATPTVTHVLDQATGQIDRLRADLNTVLRGLSDDAPMFVAVDLVTALGHLRQAAIAIDKAADQLARDERHAALDTARCVDSTARQCCGGIGGHTQDCDPLRRLGAAAQDLDAAHRLAVAAFAVNLISERTNS